MTPAEPMTLACALAEQAVGRSDPNPRVGCVIVGADGRVIGQGSTQIAGQAHAEVMALHEVTGASGPVRTGAGHRSAGSAGLGDATAYVTLEPCSHHGRTPPCCDALISAGVGRVVVALQDPNPLVAGRGLQRLREAGIAVELLPPDHPAALRSRELNIGFFSRMQRGRPWLRMKIAASLDGRTALPNGRSQWITSAASRADGHAWRRRAGAVLTGIGTVRDDDPRLDVRLVPTEVQPVRVVVDSRLDITPSARILQPPGRVWIFHAAAPEAARAWVSAWHSSRGAGAQGDAPELIACPGPGGKVDLSAMMAGLATREINELHVEAGEKLNASLLREGLVDELLLYLAPTLLGPGAALAALPELSDLSQAQRWRFEEITPVAPDLRLRLRPEAP